MAVNILEAKAHELIGQLGPGKLAAVVHLLEVMVHLEIDFEDLPSTYQLLEIDVPDTIDPERISVADLELVSQGWKEDPNITRGALLPWFDDLRTAVVAVPSAIMPFATNYLINPRHPDAAGIRVINAEISP